MLGFAAKAGKCVFGYEAVRSAARKKKVGLVVLDGRLSERSKKDALNMCSYYGLSCALLDERVAAGQACGMADAKIIGICDGGFAGRIKEIIDNTEE